MRLLPVGTDEVNKFSAQVEFSKQEAAESLIPGVVDRGMCASAGAVELAFGTQFALALQMEEGRGKVEGMSATSDDVSDAANDAAGAALAATPDPTGWKTFGVLECRFLAHVEFSKQEALIPEAADGGALPPITPTDLY